MGLSDVEVEEKFGGKLRECQKASLNVAFDYFSSPYKNKSCLISLPTGAGKSGVITAISHCSDFRRILILSNRRAVCDQLIRQLKGAFFEKIGVSDVAHKDIYSDVEDTSNEGVYVSTFQKLQSMKGSKLQELVALEESIDLLVIDEGHSEPAPSWSEIVRGIKTHKIIVTATPYRNDLFQFDLDSDKCYIYTFDQALQDGVLVGPEFSVTDKDKVVELVRRFLTEHPELKCIVKCKTFESVEEYFGLFSGEFGVLGIHERFVNYDCDFRKTKVPRDISGSEVQVIIHQMKLDEGVDIPEAKLLVLTYPVASGRELVQTVGRVVRKLDNEKAIVTEIDNDSNHRMWKNYLEFDSYLRRGAKKFLSSLDTVALIDSYLEAFPDISYFDSGYKKKFNFKNFDVSKSLNIPLASVCFIKKLPGFTIEAFLDDVSWELERTGTLASQPKNTVGIDVLFSVSFNNSKLLKDMLFFEPSLEVMVVKDLGDYVALLDSRGKDYSFETKLKLGASVDVENLLNLASRSVKTRTKEAHTKSISTSSYRPEGVSLKGDELEKTTTSQGNSSYALTTLKVDNINKEDKKDSSYYLGIWSGRVSDQKRRNFSLEELNDWISDIGAVLDTSKQLESHFISSYAKSIKEVPTSNPVNIFVDFSASDYDLHVVSGDNAKVIGNSFRYLEYTLSGVDLFDNNQVHLKLKFDEKEDRLKFKCSTTLTYADSAVNARSQGAKDFVELLNNLPVKVLYADGLSYAGGNFYRVSLPTDVVSDFESSKLPRNIIALSELHEQRLDEKDRGNVSPDEFGECSIFYLLDKLKGVSDSSLTPVDLGPFFKGIADLDLILCTDMGTEPADFILSSPSKLVFVHVKCGETDNPQSSAGAIAEVGGQAVKNLAQLISGNDDLLPGNLGSLKGKWPSPTSNPSLERLRLIDGARFYNNNDEEDLRHQQLGEAINIIKNRRRSYAVKKELWVVVGRAFSRRDFVDQISMGNDGRAESLQAYQLLDSWISTCADVDVDFKLFVSP